VTYSPGRHDPATAAAVLELFRDRLAELIDEAAPATGQGASLSRHTEMESTT